MTKSSSTRALPEGWRSFLTMLALIMAGEAVFFLPFVVPRVFRPTMLDVFGINNLELGSSFSAYGVVAMVSYFFGGPLADRFSPKVLLPVALIATSLGGLLLATLPSLTVLTGLYAYWGLTSILLFWAALMRATREWGGPRSQGKAFGWLEGGRGLMAAGVGSVGVWLFASLLPEDVESATLPQRQAAFREVVLMVSSVVAAVGVLTYLALPRSTEKLDRKAGVFSLVGVKEVIKLPTVWLQALIIVCAYVGYKGIDDFSLYAKEVLGGDEVESAQLGTLALWVRPLAALTAGLLADRLSTSGMTLISFVLITLGSLLLASGLIEPGFYATFVGSVVTGSLGVYAMRGLYYAIMQEGKVPLAFTGSAVGLVSVLGYTPDIFMGPLMGVLLDNNPGPSGHQYVFMVVSGFALMGLLATVAFRRLVRKGEET